MTETKIKESQISDLSHEIEIQEDDAQKVSGATVLNFEGGATVVDEGGGKATITVTVSGSDTKQVLVSANDTTEGYLEEKIAVTGILQKQTLNDGGDEDVELGFTNSDIDHGSLNNTHNLTTDINHDTITSGHNLTTDIDHDVITNTHNLTTDISHDTIADFVDTEHRIWEDSIAQNVHSGNITEGSVTQHEAALAITESQISDLSHNIEIQEDDAQKVADAIILNFEGDVTVVDEGAGKATVTISGSGGGSSTFLELTDSPSSYSGQAGKSAVVNSGEDALEFTTISGSGTSSWMPIVSLRRTTADDFTTSTWNIVEWEAAEQEDWEAWENVTNPERIVLDEAGAYLVTVQVRWEAGTTGRFGRIIRNGNQALELIESSEAQSSSVVEHRHSFSGLVIAAVDDYIELEVYQNSGGNLEIRGGAVDAEATRIWVVKLKA